MDAMELNDREKTILRNIIHQFVLTAAPVGSRNIARRYGLGLSPATIRNIMADLEEAGFLGHPHTSAGRVPTDKGYRFYVNTLMDPPSLTKEEKQLIEFELKQYTDETDELIRVTSTILSDITNQLAMVTYPNLDTGILERLQIVQLTSSRILVVVSITSGLVKTITLELNAELKADHIDTVQRLFNERLSGLTLAEIKRTFSERFRDIGESYKPIIRVFVDSAEKIFTDFKKSDKAVITGARNMLKQPEFEKHEYFKSIIELIEDKDVIFHFMDRKATADEDLVIRIGSENESLRLNEMSIISKEYKVGDVTGTIGIVGPRRMQYSKIIAIVVYVAEVLSEYMRKGPAK